MPQNSVKATLILRNDLAANWASKNPTLAKGEIGAESDTGLLKMGDGSTSYNSLNYINGGKSGDGALITTVNNQLTVADFGKSYWEYDNGLLEEVEVVEPDLTKWPAYLELEYRNGTARWVKPVGSYNRIEGKLDGVLVTLQRDPQTDYEAATRHYVNSHVASQIASADHLKRRVVQSLPQEPANNIIYMIKDNNATGGDKYKEYTLIDGVLTQIGDTSVDLTNYLEKPANITDGHLLSISNGALVDSGLVASEISKLVPATTSTLGGVYASTSDNYINVDNLGHMYLNRVSTDKLYVPGGSEFILNGGSA